MTGSCGGCYGLVRGPCGGQTSRWFDGGLGDEHASRCFARRLGGPHDIGAGFLEDGTDIINIVIAVETAVDGASHCI